MIQGYGDILQEYFKEQAAAFPGRTAWICRTVDPSSDNSVGCAMYAGESVVSASMIKVPILLCLMDAVRTEGDSSGTPASFGYRSESCAQDTAQPSPDAAVEGLLRLNRQIPVREDQICEDSLVFEYGPRAASLAELAAWMIVSSDNTATNVLIDHLGMDRLNRYFAACGLKSTHLERRMLDFAAVEAGQNNYISPEDFYRCMLRIYKGKDTDPMMKEAWRLLCGNRDFDGLLRYLYELPVCAHKTGGLDDIVHDAGILQTENGDYFLGVFVSEFEAAEKMCVEAQKLIGRMSRKAYDLLGGRLSS